VIVAEPTRTPRTLPWSTRAILRDEVSQKTTGPSTGRPLAPIRAAWSWSVLPTASEASAGVISTCEIERWTVMLAEPRWPSTAAVIVAVPSLIPVTRPWSTSATRGLLELQARVRPVTTSRRLSRSVAESSSVRVGSTALAGNSTTVATDSGSVESGPRVRAARWCRLRRVTGSRRRVAWTGRSLGSILWDGLSPSSHRYPESPMRRLPILPLVLSCVACHDYLAPTDAAPGAVRVPVSSEYRGWWRELEECIGRTAPLAARFFVVPQGEQLIDPNTGMSAEGLWIGHGEGPGSGDILVRERGRHRAALLKHEMLHAILYAGDHDDPVWRLGSQCGFDGRG